MTFDFRTRRIGAAALATTFLGGVAAGSLTVNPAAAAGVVSLVTTVSCSVTGSNWCVSGNNSSSGIGVIGTSKTGTGLRGTSTSQYGLKATSVSGTAILAQTTSGPAAINASGALHGTGLLASGAVAVSGTGKTYGLYGSSPITGAAGSGGSVGVAGFSTSGTGVQAESDGGYGLYAQSSSTDSNTGAITGVNTQPFSGTAAYFQGNIGVVSNSNAYTFVGDDSANHGATTFSVDSAGNITYHGQLTSMAVIGRGATVKSFSAHSTQPTVEDTGTAQLIGGAATVRLDPTFAASIEGVYRVFVTPSGDTRGLFVAAKSPGGFVVHESQGGRSSVSFDYRIVATALGQTGKRMALVNAAALEPHILGVAVPRARVPGLKAPAAEPPSP